MSDPRVDPRVIEIPAPNHNVREVLDEEDIEENVQAELTPLEPVMVGRLEPVIAAANETESNGTTTSGEESVILEMTKYEDDNYYLDVDDMVKVRVWTPLIRNWSNRSHDMAM